MLEQIVQDHLMLFVTIDPVGTLAIFVMATAGMSLGECRRVAIRATICGGVVLFAFLIVGQVLLSGIGIRLVSFQLAGGVILFLLGIQMVFGTGVASAKVEPGEGRDVAIFPIALPTIAGPGSILAIVVLTDNHRYSVGEQAITAVALLVILIMTLVVMLLAAPLHRVLGQAGTTLMTRIMGLILAALAAEQIVAGFEVVVNELR
jgi:multiple antibiotic resistance protein